MIPAEQAALTEVILLPADNPELQRADAIVKAEEKGRIDDVDSTSNDGLD